MDPVEYADAVERLEQDYLAGGMSADEYTSRRRELEERASTPEDDPEETVFREPMPPMSAAEQEARVPGDAVTGAQLASWGRRAGGWFVDLLVYVVAFVATFALALTTEDATGEVSTFAALLIFVVWFLGPTLYAWLMVGAWGQTVGKMAVGITVVRSADARRVSYLRSLGRAVSTWLLGLLFFPIVLAYLWPLWDERNQTLYDKMAGTIVVRGGAGAPAD
ncbi:MAG: RDD family protein [Gaiellaceae bacterium]